jgi:Rrf2 family protein
MGMAISARVHYAALAMLELAIRGDSSAPVTVREMTDRHRIPGPFLVQILRSLRAVGWVQSIRGSQGGYRLSVNPAEITLLEIAEAVGCQETGAPSEPTASKADLMLQEFWEEASEASRTVLGGVRLSDLVERCRHGDATMFYI